MVLLTINRMGEFVVHDTSEHPSQCGQVGRRQYKYKVSITGSEVHLDNQGFVMDNAIIHEYFDKTYSQKEMKCLSCELMACQAIDFIKKFCAQNNIEGITKIYIQIWGSEFSFIEGEWKQ